MNKKMTLVCRMEKSAVTNLGPSIPLKLYEGMLGMMPVFESMKAAKKAYPKGPFCEIELLKDTL